MVESLGDIITYLGIVVVGFLIWAALAPVEMLGWWAGWFGDTIYDDAIPPDGLVRMMRPNRTCYVIFLSGIGRASGENFSYREQDFLRQLAAALPHAVVIDDIFPYPVNNLVLTGQPVFARLWQWALQRKLNGPRFAGYLINVRNIWQLMISADKRYGPIYNQATAEVVLHGLLRYSYDPKGDVPIFLIGYSGAGQMAIGAVTYLKEWIHAPIYVISLGGIFSSDPGVLAVDHLYHLYGDADHAHHWGMLAPGRWKVFPASEWNRARRQRKVTAIRLGPMGHTGAEGYLDAKSELPDGTKYVEKTVQAIEDIVHRSLGIIAVHPVDVFPETSRVPVAYELDED